MPGKAEDIVRRYEYLRGQRLVHEIVWRECFEFSFPIRSSGFNGDQIWDAQQAADKRARLLDSTSTDAGKTLASALVSGLTPANARWFELEVDGATDVEKAWLDEAADTLHQLIHSADFDSAALECSLDMVGAGWFVMFVDENVTHTGMQFSQWPMSQVFCASSRVGGPVDTVYRCYPLTAQQAQKEFGAAASQSVQALAKDKPYETVEFLHTVYPREEGQGGKLARNMPIVSCQLELKSKVIVRESGYHEMPAIVPRWEMIPNSVYAVGPMFDALPDAKTLNELKLGQLQAVALALLPPLKATDDGVINIGGIKKLQSGKIYAVNDIDNLQPILTGSKMEVAFTSEERLQASIRRTLMADQLQAQDGPTMTATEVHARMALMRQLLGPRYGRMQPEYLSALVTRCFGMAYRAGALGDPPDSLIDRAYSVKYISPLARAQKLEDVTAIERLNVNVGQIAAVQPNVLDNIDTDEQVRVLSNALGVPAKTIRGKKQVIDIRDARTKAQQQATQQAQAQEMQMLSAQSMAKRTEKTA